MRADHAFGQRCYKFVLFNVNDFVDDFAWDEHLDTTLIVTLLVVLLSLAFLHLRENIEQVCDRNYFWRLSNYCDVVDRADANIGLSQ